MKIFYIKKMHHLMHPVLIQIFSVAFDTLLVPVEGILSLSFKSSFSLVVHVDIDHAVAFFDLTGRSGFLNYDYNCYNVHNYKEK